MNLSKKFSKYIEHEENYKTVYNIVRQNSKGKVWLIGGGLSRNLNQLIHGTPQRSFDFDFIVEKGVEKIKLPKGWISRKNKSGYLRFKKGNISISSIFHFRL